MIVLASHGEARVDEKFDRLNILYNLFFDVEQVCEVHAVKLILLENRTPIYDNDRFRPVQIFKQFFFATFGPRKFALARHNENDLSIFEQIHDYPRAKHRSSGVYTSFPGG